MLRAIGCIAVVLYMSGCGAQLRPDRFPAAVLSNYPSAEFYACGERWLGIGYCEIEAGHSVEEVGFAVQGFYRGRIRIFSEALPSDVTFRYSSSRRVEIPLSGAPRETIVIGMAVNPEYPAEQDAMIDLYGTVGWLIVNVIRPGEEFTFSRTRLPTSVNQFTMMPTEGARELMAVSEECQIEEVLPVSGPETRVWLTSLTSNTRSLGSCLVFLATDTGRMKVWASWRYAEGFRPLAIPDVEVNGGKIKVRGETGVTIVALDSHVVVNREGEFGWDPSKSHILRLLTVKGRTLVGEYEPGEGWTWKN